jgi:FkbM family methyltransferase
MIQQELVSKRGIFFVQVGSNDGVHSDPVRPFVLKYGWRGILIEPVSYVMKRLKANYASSPGLIFEQVAVGDTCKRKFYYVAEAAAAALGEALPSWWDQLGSFDKNHIVNHLGRAIEPFVVEEEVECLPLPQILARHSVRSVDLLHIDAEGSDYEILHGLLSAGYPVRVILYEHRHLSEAQKHAADELLGEHGYRVHKFDFDTLAILKTKRR